MCADACARYALTLSFIVTSTQCGGHTGRPPSAAASASVPDSASVRLWLWLKQDSAGVCAALAGLVSSGLLRSGLVWSGLFSYLVASRLVALRRVACGRVGVASCRFQRCALPLNWGLIECPEALDDDDDGDDDDDTEAEKAEMEVTLTPFKQELRGCWKDTMLCCLRVCVSCLYLPLMCVRVCVCVCRQLNDNEKNNARFLSPLCLPASAFSHSHSLSLLSSSLYSCRRRFCC